MDRKSWLWRKKSSEKSPGETESSGSMSSHSERYSDDQDASRGSPNHSTQSPEVTSKSATAGVEVDENMKMLKEKLSAAYANISAKDDLVKQHSKVAEEAVSGWEKAETEAGILKQQLEASAQKNSALENRVGHLDGALKECVRQLRQAREEQEQKIQEVVTKKSREWESMKLQLENQLVELQTQVETAKTGAAYIDSELHLKLEAAEKENSALKLKLLARAEELEVRTLERDLSTQTAENASKQHLDSIKKMAKLEAECRRLKAMARKSSSANDKSVTSSSIYVDSLTDSQSDSGERLLAVEADTRKMSSVELNGCEPSYSDSWASALIAELDQFKNEKAIDRNLTSSTVDIDLMDDFLEMERLAALPETQSKKRGESEATSERQSSVDVQRKAEIDAMIKRIAELEEALEKIETEKARLEIDLTEIQERLGTTESQLREAEDKLVKLQAQLDLVNESKNATEVEIEAANLKREVVESQLVAADAEVRILRTKVESLETEVEEERALSAETIAKYKELEDELLMKRQEDERRRAVNSNGELKIKQEKELAVAAGKLAECQKTIASLGQQLKSLATLEDFLIDSDKPFEVNGESPKSSELRKLDLSDNVGSKRHRKPSKIMLVDGSSPSMNGKDGESPGSSSSSSSSHAGSSEKSRNGFGKLFSRSKNGFRLGNQ